MYQITSATKKVRALNRRIRAIQGGTSASKTVSILIDLIDRAQRDKSPTLTSIVSESFPHLRRGVMRDFLNIMQEHKYFKDSLWDKTNSTYNFETGSQIEFFSVEQSEKVRGARRDRLFINEANNIPFSAFEELEVRTREFIYLDWNPVSTFWFYDDVKGKREDVDHITLTYLDNEGLDQSIRDSIETRKNRPGWWKVYGLGELGEAEGRIYAGWNIVKEVPHEARLERYGLDFGYRPDPSAIVAVYYYNGGYILDEIAYSPELKNSELASIFLNLPRQLIVADAAEPKSIDELTTYGLTVIPCTKGADSIGHGIKVVQEQQISMTDRSINLIKEYRNYLWAKDKNDKIIPGVPEGGFDHLLDASRYAITSIAPVLKRLDQMYSWKTYRSPKTNQNPAR